MNTSSKASAFTLDASFCQDPLKWKEELKSPRGIFPVIDKFWLKCSDIYTKEEKTRRKKKTNTNIEEKKEKKTMLHI